MTREEQDHKNFTDCVQEAMKRLCHIWRGHKPQDGIIVQNVGFDGKKGAVIGIYDNCTFYMSLMKYVNGTFANIDVTNPFTGFHISVFMKSGAFPDEIKRAVRELREFELMEKQRKEEVARTLLEARRAM